MRKRRGVSGLPALLSAALVASTVLQIGSPVMAAEKTASFFRIRGGNHGSGNPIGGMDFGSRNSSAGNDSGRDKGTGDIRGSRDRGTGIGGNDCSGISGSGDTGRYQHIEF